MRPGRRQCHVAFHVAAPSECAQHKGRTLVLEPIVVQAERGQPWAALEAQREPAQPVSAPQASPKRVDAAQAVAGEVEELNMAREGAFERSSYLPSAFGGQAVAREVERARRRLRVLS